MKMTSGTKDQILKSSLKRNRNSIDCENDEKDVKKIATRQSSLKNSMMSKFSNLINGPTGSSRCVKHPEKHSKMMEYRMVKGLPFHHKFKIGLKSRLFFSDHKKPSEKFDCVKEIVEKSDDLSSHFFSTETEKVRNCKHCNHVTMAKSDYWEHLKIHIEENVRWSCPLCKFITANKYHLMHHFREHVGSIPTKCFKFVHAFWDKSKLSTQIISLTEQLKLRNIRKRQDFHRLRTLELECVSV